MKQNTIQWVSSLGFSALVTGLLFINHIAAETIGLILYPITFIVLLIITMLLIRNVL